MYLEQLQCNFSSAQFVHTHFAYVGSYKTVSTSELEINRECIIARTHDLSLLIQKKCYSYMISDAKIDIMLMYKSV